MNQPPTVAAELSDPRVRQLDHAAAKACTYLCEAIETAALAGVSVETIASCTNKPIDEVQLIVTELQEQQTQHTHPVPHTLGEQIP